MVIIIQSIASIIYLLLKKAVVAFYFEEKEAWDSMKSSYYWLEYVFIFTCTIVTPKHTYNEGIITLIVVILIKIIFDRLTFIDNYFTTIFKRASKK